MYLRMHFLQPREIVSNFESNCFNEVSYDWMIRIIWWNEDVLKLMLILMLIWRSVGFVRSRRDHSGGGVVIGWFFIKLGASECTLTPTDLFFCLALGLCGLELVQASYNKEIGTILTLYDSYLKSRIILKFVFYSCSISHRSKTIKADVKIELKHTLLFLLPIC